MRKKLCFLCIILIVTVSVSACSQKTSERQSTQEKTDAALTKPAEKFDQIKDKTASEFGALVNTYYTSITSGNAEKVLSVFPPQFVSALQKQLQGDYSSVMASLPMVTRCSVSNYSKYNEDGLEKLNASYDAIAEPALSAIEQTSVSIRIQEAYEAEVKVYYADGTNAVLDFNMIELSGKWYLDPLTDSVTIFNTLMTEAATLSAPATTKN